MSIQSFHGDIPEKEWLVTDGLGGFAMGTPEGLRTRKYHGFYLGIPGRSETSFLADFVMTARWDGKVLNLWPHRYLHGSDSVDVAPDYRLGPEGPEWQWTMPDGMGALRFSVNSQRGRGIELQWSRESQGSRKLTLELRPFFAMRPLHSVGGMEWQLTPTGNSATVRASIMEPVFLSFEGSTAEPRWRGEPYWYNEFFYREESERGYPAEENLYSAGFWSTELSSSSSVKIFVSAKKVDASNRGKTRAVKTPSLDFALENPPGIVAGYPWFGEWGRDTFISLPGIAMSWLEAGGKSAEVHAWCEAVLTRWGRWIELTGMLPNLIEKGESNQWESADATLWWCHSLASLWCFGIAGESEFLKLEAKFKSLLQRAIESIRSGRHVFLKKTEHDMLEVTEPHSTWMDARIEGCAVTPRIGLLPEVNALWFQARALETLWSGTGSLSPSELEALGQRILTHARGDAPEPDRPNFIFLHSIPLAPSFVLKSAEVLRSDLIRARQLWTPVGLRSLDPKSTGYRARCVGTQKERDASYHQGTVWGWLGGHYMMMKDRAKQEISNEKDDTLSAGVISRMPIHGHVAEIFDGEEPFTARGAPAQAWSVACLDEARARRRLQVNSKITDVLSRRWMGREERRKLSGT